MILILGPDDIHTQRVRSCIEARGEAVSLLTTDTYPREIQWSSDINGMSQLLLPNRRTLDIHSVKSIYWYAHSGLAYGTQYNPMEAESAFGSFLRNIRLRSDCLWVNPLEAIQQHQYKFHQLYLLHQQGIRVPDTLATNHPEDLLTFFDKHQGNIICKPFYQGTHLHQVSKEDLTPEKLFALKQAPTLFQEYIQGQDIRVHIVGEQAFPSAIISEQFNYKTSFRVGPLQLPDDVIQTCFKVAKILGLVLAGVDLRRTDSGEYVVFEANPSPQYLTFENQIQQSDGEYPITNALVDCLISTRI